MSDDDPTTDDMCEQYVAGAMVTGFAYSRREAREDFDRWLAAHDAELRERIVREIVGEAQAMTRSSAHLLGGSSEKNAAYRTGICDGLTGAARIARGEQP
mgnify:CR=1 FL=1